MLLIGSHAALALELPLGRKPVDIDLIVSPTAFTQLREFLKEQTSKVVFIDQRRVALFQKTGEILELEIAWPGSSAEKLLRLGGVDTTITVGEHRLPVQAAFSSVQLALKLSHRYRKDSPHFLKTMQDIHFLREWGARVDGLEEVIKLRENETYTYAHPNLKRSKKAFFADDAIKYVYDHDSIHVAVAHLHQPAYRFFATDGEEVLSSRDRWNQISEEIRLYAVVEESYVLALERSQIPFRGKVDPKRSFDMALMKVCSSITSGWFREYAWEHYNEAQGLFYPGYSTDFFTKADAGKIALAA